MARENFSPRPNPKFFYLEVKTQRAIRRNAIAERVIITLVRDVCYVELHMRGNFEAINPVGNESIQQGLPWNPQIRGGAIRDGISRAVTHRCPNTRVFEDPLGEVIFTDEVEPILRGLGQGTQKLLLIIQGARRGGIH